MPYNPGIASTVGPSLQAGISQGAGRLAALFEGMANDASKAKSLRQVVKAYNPDIPTDHLSLGELEGIVQGQAIKQAQQRQSLADQMQRDGLEIQRGHLRLSEALGKDQMAARAWQQNPDNPNNRLIGAETDQIRRRLDSVAQGDERMQRFNRAYADRAASLGSIGLTPNPSDMTSLAAQMGVLGDPNVDRLLSETLRHHGDSEAPLTEAFTEDPITQQRFVKYGKQILPSGVAARQEDNELIPQKDEKGRTIGYAMRGAKGAKTFVRDPSQLSPQERIGLRKAIADAKLLLDPKGDPTEQAALQSDIEEMRSQLGSGGVAKPTGNRQAESGSSTLANDPKAEEIRLRYRQGKLTREQANQMLQKLLR